MPAGGTMPPARLEQVAALRTMIADPVFSDEEREAVAQVLEGITERRAASWITKLEEQLVARRQQLASAPPAAAPAPPAQPVDDAPAPPTSAPADSVDPVADLRRSIAGLLVNPQIPLRLRREQGELYYGAAGLDAAALQDLHDRLTAALPSAPVPEGQPA